MEVDINIYRDSKYFLYNFFLRQIRLHVEDSAPSLYIRSERKGHYTMVAHIQFIRRSVNYFSNILIFFKLFSEYNKECVYPHQDSRAQFNCTYIIGRFNSKISEQAILHISDRPWWFAVYRTIHTQHGPYGSKKMKQQQQMREMVMSTYIQREHTIYSKQDLYREKQNETSQNQVIPSHTTLYTTKTTQIALKPPIYGAYTGFP